MPSFYERANRRPRGAGRTIFVILSKSCPLDATAKLFGRHRIRPGDRREHRTRLRAGARAVALAGLARERESLLVVINFQGGNDGLNTVVPLRQSDYYRCARRWRSPQATFCDRPGRRAQPRHAPVQEDVRQRQGRDRAGRRLSRSRSLALPLDRDLADRRSPRATSRPAGSDATSTPPGCRRTTSSTRRVSTTCCPS